MQYTHGITCDTVSVWYVWYVRVPFCLACGVRCSASSECKLLLWWFKIVELCLRQIDFGADHRHVFKVLLAITPALISLGEDKSTAGLLGAIGFGRRSPLSYRSPTVTLSASCSCSYCIYACEASVFCILPLVDTLQIVSVFNSGSQQG